MGWWVGADWLVAGGVGSGVGAGWSPRAVAGKALRGAGAVFRERGVDFLVGGLGREKLDFHEVHSQGG